MNKKKESLLFLLLANSFITSLILTITLNLCFNSVDFYDIKRSSLKEKLTGYASLYALSVQSIPLNIPTISFPVRLHATQVKSAKGPANPICVFDAKSLMHMLI